MNDPLLYKHSTIDQLEKQLEQLKRQQVSVRVDMPMPNNQERTVWDEITDELNSMTESQKQLLFSDADYQKNDQTVASIAAKYQMSLLMPYVANDPEGKKALETQLLTIRSKKDAIIKRESEELEEFRRWKMQQSGLARESQDAQ